MLPLTARVCPDWIGFQVLHRRGVQLKGVVLFSLAERALSGRLLLEDIIDRVLAFVIIVTAAPLLVVIAVVIRLDSRGPVLFRQQRYGFNREIIEVLKFPTMYADRSAPVVQARKNRPRVTRAGMCLCQISFDELPQPFDLLRTGDILANRNIGAQHDCLVEEISVCGPACKRLALVRCRGAG